MIKKYISCSSLDTEKIGKELSASLGYPAFVALYGDLGAGKTAFVRGMVSHYSSDALVTSPTYNIVNEYSFADKHFYHFDMYRITDDDDLYSVGFYDYVDNGIVVCEWSENIPYALPREYTKVTISKCDDNIREVTVETIKC